LPPIGWEEPERLLAVADRNATLRQPLQNGLGRRLPPTAVALTSQGLRRGASVSYAGGRLARSTQGDLRWAGRFEVASAWRLRLGLAGLRLPPGTEMWVVGGDGETVGPFGLELLGPNGTLWTPSVSGPTIALEVRVPAAALAGRELGSVAHPRFTVDRVLELLTLDERGSPLAAAPSPIAKGQECQVDAQCVGDATLSGIDSLQKGIAHLQFVVDGDSYVCSGGLLNDTDPSGYVPYFLTANHCISTQDTASSLEAYFDYTTGACGAGDPGLGGLPRTNGSTLLGHSEQSDYCFLRLASSPAGGRYFFGWTTTRQPIGTAIHRLAHPDGKPQVYSRTRVVDSQSPYLCDGLPTSDFIYSDEEFSGTAGGSSGGLSFLGNGQVVGQLFGACGSNTDDPCDDASQDTIDGAFGSTYAAIARYLNPSGGSGNCRADGQTLCLLGGRYEAKVTWRNQYSGASGNGGAVGLTDFSGLYYFDNAENIELMLKVLDFGGGVVKVFYGQLTDLEFTLRLRDTASGRTKTYGNSAGNCGAIDQSFQGLASDVVSWKSAEPATPAKAVCTPTANRLCLLDNRFAIEADWRNQYNGQSGRATTPSPALSRLSGTFAYSDPRNVELLVKTLDFGDRILFIWGALSDLEYTIRVTDTRTGQGKTYVNPGGQYCGGLDNNFGTGGGGGGGTNVTEVEPNDGPSQAQVLSGGSPIVVSGRAEAADVGQVVIRFDSGGTDDVEDLYRVTTRGAGLQVRLSGLGADSDIYLFDSSGATVLGYSNASGAVDEAIDGGALGAGTYLVGVSIYDGGGAAATGYSLRLDGSF
jgi:hypothetical protein